MQLDNHCPGSPYPVALYPTAAEKGRGEAGAGDDGVFLALSVRVDPVLRSEIRCIKAVHMAMQDLTVKVDVSFLVRLQSMLVNAVRYFEASGGAAGQLPLMLRRVANKDWLVRAEGGGGGGEGIYFELLNIRQSDVHLSLDTSRPYTEAEAKLEGKNAAAIHAGIIKGDLNFGEGGVSVKKGGHNRTAAAIAGGVTRSIFYNALLRVDDAIIQLEEVGLRHHVAGGVGDVGRILVPHYIGCVRSSMGTLVGSMTAFGNPLGLLKGFGEGATDFVREPFIGEWRGGRWLALWCV